MAPVVAQSHHHRSTTKKDKKGFKARHATKGALKELNKGMKYSDMHNIQTLTDQKAKSSLSPSNAAAEKLPTSKSCLNSTAATARSRCA